MMRQIIEIDEEKCDGCGLCTDACEEGALKLVDGKAKLIRDDYCDGMGNCLPVCPAGAISFVVRDAAPFDENAVANNVSDEPKKMTATGPSELTQWPIQLKLVPLQAPLFDEAELVIASDCSAFACGDFHRRFLKGKKLMIGCPKFDAGDYPDRMAQIFKNNRIKNITLIRMEVPCCAALDRMVRSGIMKSMKKIPYRVITLKTDGTVV